MGIRIDYSLEDRPLGTMGPLKVIDDLPDNFLVMSGDILTDLDYADFYEKHVKDGEEFTISSYVREQLIDYGVLDTADGRLISLREKPRVNYEVSMGVYMVSKRVIGFIPGSSTYGFDNLMHDLLAAKRKISVRKFSGYWLDIGRPDDYAQAIDEFDNMRNRFIK